MSLAIDAYRAVLDLSPEAILLLVEGRVRDASATARRLLGDGSDGALLGRELASLSAPTQPDGQRAVDVLDRRMREALAGTPQRFAWAFLRTDGATLIARVDLTAIPASPGAAALMARVRDAARAEREDRYHLISLATRDALYDWDIHTNLTWRNEAYQALYSPHAPVGDDETWWEEHIHPDDRARVLSSIGAAFKSGCALWAGEYRFMRHDGVYADVIDQGYIIRDEAGAPTRMVGAIKDVSERKAVDRLKGEFISTVSHELRTPMTSIRGALGLLEGGVLGPLAEEAQEVIQIARVNTDRLVRLINDILDLEKLEAGKLTLKLGPVDVPRLVAVTLDGLRAMAQRADVALSAQVHAEGRLQGDEDRLVQVLTNLVSNAIKFSPRGERVLVWVTVVPSGRVRFTVTDRGPGIPPEAVRRLFVRFQQLDGSDRRATGGTGLGLAISKAIIEQHGGEVGVESRAGEGSTFWFELPRGDQ